MTSGRSTPNKLTALDRALLLAAVDLGLWSKRHVARAFGVSETRLYQILRERLAA